ncbi:hypothetical protein C1H46_000245 [Malus baccata]|uniref:FANCL UBC-like domain-containing protein n=1 Tax=Malus baccata TaxID=106549 RepID=A0A540NTG8_MALBA|nr:hypothetical protein C1H46_000245 [Malus baccata]
MHVVEICLDKTHPKSPPPISANVPDSFNLKWSSNSRLKDVVQQFKKHLETLQAFWSTLDDIDRSLWVVDPKQASPDVSYCQIIIGNDCCIVLSINSVDPRTLPETLKKIKDELIMYLSINMNYLLECLLETQLPTPPDVEKNDQMVECGSCYAQSLPIEIRVELELTMHSIIPAATRLSTAYVLWTGCALSPHEGSHLMSYLEAVHTVQNQLRFPECSSNAMKFSPEEHKFWINVHTGAEDEFRGQRGRKYRPVVDNDRAVLEMSPMDPSSSSSSSSSLPVHQASLKYVCFLYLRLRDLNGGLRMNFDALCFWFNGLIVENELNPQVHLMI